MPTPLYNTDVQKIVDRTPKTALLDTDVFVVADEDGTLAPITKPNAKATLGVDDAEDRLDTLEGADTVDGSVLKDIKDNAENATYNNTDSGLSATTLKTAIDENAGNVGNLAGAGRTTETVKQNADAILTKVKLTKMPDGATAVYSQDAWATNDGWTNISGGAAATVGGGSVTIPATGIRKTLAGFSAKTFIGKVTTTAAGTLRVGTASVYTSITVPLGTGVVMGQIPVASGDIDISNLACTCDWIWIGDYSYLNNSLSTESSRIANQLGDTAGVGTKASGTITSNGTNVSDGDTVTIAGKVYTFKTALTPAEGEVLIGALYTNSLINLHRAINRSGGTIGVDYQVASPHPLVVSALGSGLNIITAKTIGLLGNSITLATTASTLTFSGSTLTGGTDDVGEKLRTQIASLNWQWITPTLANSWVVYDTRTAKYMKDAQGCVRLKGVVKNGTVGLVMLTLPAGYRPPETQTFPCVSNGAFGYITITSAGATTCTVGNNASVFLDGITFKAEA